MYDDIQVKEWLFIDYDSILKQQNVLKQQSIQENNLMTEQPFDYTYLNMDFNSIHQSRQLQIIIIQLKAIIQNKIKQINELSSVYAKQNQQHELIIQKMTEKNQSNKRRIDQYSQLIFSVSQQYSRFNKQSDQEKQKQKKLIETTHQIEATELNKKIQELQQEYKKLKQYEDLQTQYINKIQSLKKQIITKQYQHNDGMNVLQANELKENQQLQKKLTLEVNKTMKTAPAHALNKITTELKTNQQLNIILKQKLFTLQAQLQKLKKQRNQILYKRKQLKINVTLNQDQLQQYKAVGSLQKAKIKAYKDKIQAMKILISDQIAKKEKSLTEHKKKSQSAFKMLRQKLNNLQKDKEELKLKIQKMNLLAETILQQRTQIEEFFIMALQSCKKEVEEYDKNSTIKSNQQKSYGEKVDIGELLPKDKQRILTNLYTKLAFGSVGK